MPRSLVPWGRRAPSVFRPFEQEMEDLMERFFGEQRDWGTEITFAPRADVAETDKGYEVKMDLPGIEPEDISVEVRDGSLVVSGERNEEKEEKGKTFHRIERHYGTFRRTIPLGSPIDSETVEAEDRGGVLTIRLAKKPEAQAKKIEVKS